MLRYCDTSHRARFALVALCLGFSLFAPATAEEGRIPIFETTTLDGSTGAISGRYVLTRNITSERPLLILGTGVEEIDLDLNGFTLEGTTLAAIEARDLKTLKVRNGTARTASASTAAINVLNAGTSETVIVEDVSALGGVSCLRIQNTADTAVRRVVCRDATGGANAGIELLGGAAEARGVVEDCLLRDLGGDGILGLSMFDLVLKNNRIVGAGRRGIFAGATTVVAEDNNVENSNTIGIQINATKSSRVVRNVVHSSGTHGIVMLSSRNCLLSDNVSSANMGEGTFLTGTRYCQVTDNVFSENGSSGLRLDPSSAWNHIEHNTLSANQNVGLHIESNDNTFGRNTARANLGTGAPVCGTAPPGAGCSAPNFCDNGIGNSSFGDNLAPGPPAC